MRANKFLLCLLAFISVNSLSFAVEDKSIITVEPGIKIDYEVILSSSMNAGLKKFRTDFKIWKQINFTPKVISEYKYTTYQSPSVVFGDFNDDGTIDVVLMGYGEYQKHILLLKSRKDKYVVHEIWMGSGLDDRPESTRNIELSLTLHPKGEIMKGNTKYIDACNKVLKKDAFAVKNFDVENIETLFSGIYMTGCIMRK